MSGAGLWYAAAASGPKEPKQIILTSGTSWTVPSDWNNANNKVECIGAGFLGGGAYAKKNNLALTAGAITAVHIGSTSANQSIADTWFGSTATVKAAGSIGLTGGSAAFCVGDTIYRGGNNPSTGTLCGGGGAAGPNGNGIDALSVLPFGGGAGDAGLGGAGGAGGAVGGNGTEWGSVGAGGGGGQYQSGGIGGNGGLYGGGGGSGSSGNGVGAPGVIVITYTPA